jgi:LacI family transcriptional regulator
MSSLHTRRIDVLVPMDLTIGRSVLMGASAWARQNPAYRVLAVGTAPGAQPPVGSIGAVVMAGDAEVEVRLARWQIPLVNTSSRLTPAHWRVPRVINHDRAIGRLAAEHLLERGFRNFLFLGYPDHYYAQLRLGGFRDRLGEAGLTCDQASPPGSVEGVRRVIEVLKARSGPLAAFATNDHAAKQTVLACVEAGLDVPGDVAVLGVDNDQIECEQAMCPLSSIQIAAEKIGYLAAQRVADIAAGTSQSSEPVLVDPIGVVVRQSTDVVAVGDPLVARAIRFIRNHASEPIGVENVLEEIPLSRRMLERRFRAAVGRTVVDEIRRHRISRAKELITSSDLSLSEIARVAGFGEPYYFSRVFRQQTGETPRAFRRRHQLR